MKRKTAALYDPYLDVMGGGERHILSIMKVLQQAGYDIDIFWPEDLSGEMKEKLNLSFEHKVTFIPGWKEMGVMNRFQKLGNYDIFFYVTDGSYFFSSAKENYVFSMVPQKNLYTMSPINLLKTLNYTFISNSEYTRKWLQTWGIKSKIIYPYIDDQFLQILTKTLTKKPIILSVGRFFKQLHAKRQDITIEWFKTLKKKYPQYKDYTLVLAGGVKNEDTEYIRELMTLAENRSDIVFKQNISFDELFALYQEAEYYWHFAGYGIDTKTEPEKVEHLGITPLEAMAAGCITCAFKAGGPEEIITSGENGLLFSTQSELFNGMNSLRSNKELQTMIQANAKRYVVNNFSFKAFEQHVYEVILHN